MAIKNSTLVLLMLAFTVLGGCQATSVESPDRYDIAYDMSSVHGMRTGEWYRFDLHGYDSDGNPWSGTVSKRGGAGAWLDGVWAIPTITEMSLWHEPSGGRLYDSTALYLDQFGKEVMLELADGTVCYPRSNNDIPLYAYDGDFGSLGTMMCSDGSELYGVWDLYRNADLSADYVTLSSFWYGRSEESSFEITQTLEPDGSITGYAISFYEEGYGVSVWLSSD